MNHFIFYLSILLISLCISSCTTHLYFVRHAEKRNSTDTTTLSLLGQKRANALSELLIHSSIDSIYCTKYIRTQQTAQPLSHAIHKPIIIYNLDSIREFSQKLVNQKGKNILVESTELNQVYQQKTKTTTRLKRVFVDYVITAIPGAQNQTPTMKERGAMVLVMGYKN